MRGMQVGVLWCIVATPMIHADESDVLVNGVRGVATRAPAGMVIDGNLQEFRHAFCTPINYFHPDVKNRAAQFFYMWDDEAFYSALRTLDEKRANPAPDDRLWEGDGVEWYFDTRRGDTFRSQTWTNDGSVHCYWTGLTGAAVQPRFCLRPGYLDAIAKIGIEVGARQTPQGMEVEFKLPWKNFPHFTPRPGEVIAIDAELCYSDGGTRVDRFFAYGSPLSVQQPASLAPVQLIESLQGHHWKSCAAVMMPLRCDTAWGQPDKPQVTATIALPPNHSESVGRIVIRVSDLYGHTIGEHVAKHEVIESAGDFAIAKAEWSNDAIPPGQFHVDAIVYSKEGKELGRIAPRLVSTSMQPGY